MRRKMANKLREGLVTPEIAVLYCATDSARASDLLRHLRLLGDVRGFSVWDETMIPAGADRSAEIRNGVRDTLRTIEIHEMTGSVHALSVGTQRVRRGEFEHRTAFG